MLTSFTLKHWTMQPADAFTDSPPSSPSGLRYLGSSIDHRAVVISVNYNRSYRDGGILTTCGSTYNTNHTFTLPDYPNAPAPDWTCEIHVSLASHFIVVSIDTSKVVNKTSSSQLVDDPPLSIEWQVESSPYVVVKMIKDASDVALPECARITFCGFTHKKKVFPYQDTPMVVNTGGFTITYSTVPVTSDTWKGELEIHFLDNCKSQCAVNRGHCEMCMLGLRDSIGYTNKDDVCEDYVKVSVDIRLLCEDKCGYQTT
ncbi:hypothetical protein Btru_068227 [Bulinus truncatus]|nr:hypothetical protein Btru_068227 [Bulinus truncatus]